MDTAAAAVEAHVTAATIRTWCRRNVVAAVKRAGRWVIDTASLATRIALGAKRHSRKAAAMTEPTVGDLAGECDRRATAAYAARDQILAGLDRRTAEHAKRGHGPRAAAYRAFSLAASSWDRAARSYIENFLAGDKADYTFARGCQAEAVERQAKADALAAAL